MENTWNLDNVPVDDSLLEKVNPVFNTARMTLFQLAANGNTDAAALAKSMGLTLEATQNSTNTKAAIHRGRSNLQGRACPITVWIFRWSFGKYRIKSVN